MSTVLLTFNMDDLPESLRMRPRRQAMFNSSAREVSEDGDFVTLKQVRKKHEESRGKSKRISTIEEDGKEKVLSETDSGIDASKTYSEHPSRPMSARSLASPEEKQLETLRVQLFDTAGTGSVSQISELLTEVERQTTLYSVSMHDPTNGMNVLHWALSKRRLDVAELILKRGSAELAKQEFHLAKGTRCALHQITELGDKRLANILLSKFKSISDKLDIIRLVTEVAIQGQRPRTFSSFHLAAFKGFTDLVNFYLDTGIDIDLVNVKKDTALLWAARWGHDDTVTCLLNRNANVNIENDKKSTALHWAVRYQYSSTVRLLLEKGRADANHERLLGLVTPLVLASAIGNNEIVSLLLNHNAQVNQAIRGGETALHHAAKEGHLDVVGTLLNKGANIQQEDEKGDRALNLAASKGHAYVVKLLIMHGADISHKNHIGHDSWYYAMVDEENEVLKVLTSHYTELKRNNDQLQLKSPISIAASHGMCEKLKRLLQLGVDPLEKDIDGNTFLHHAAIHNQHEVIHQFHKKGKIDAQNNKNETALHIACNKGHFEAATELMANKAKSNIGNMRGENALHITALSPNTSPELARAVMEHTIKSHDWESVNSVDNYGNNALHLAGIYATPDILWEFRFVRFKDTDVDGNTPLHEAVRPDEPEILETALDIYENMQRDANLNTYNNNCETVLHLAASAGFSESVTRLIFLGGDLTCKDMEGNTILHRLVKATVDDSSKQRVYMRVVETIFHESVRWWCIKNKLRYPGDNKALFTQFQRKAILSLVNDYNNKYNLSVLGYAFKLGADRFLSRILTMPDVTSFKREGKLYFDVTHMTPQTNQSRQKYCGTDRVAPSASFVELLVTVDVKTRAAQVLDIPPVRQIERMYNSICAWAYTFFMLLHVLYMSVFSYLGIMIADKFRDSLQNNTSVSLQDDNHVIASYIIVPIEPIIFTLFVCVMIYRIIFGRERAKINTVLTFLCILVFSFLVFAWLIMVQREELYQDYVLSICLCLGWLYTIFFTRGFRGVHYFYRMLLNMIVRDVVRFIIVYVFVLLAFSFALHVVFQISSGIVETYKTPGDTIFLVFNLMIGMAELFDDSFEQGMESAGRTATFAKAVYLFYIILSTIVLLNLLIAMMNDSYSDILSHQRVTWRVDSVQIGVGVENIFPWFPSVFGRTAIQKIDFHDDSNNKDVIGERYYLVTTEAETELYRPEEKSSEEEVELLLENRLQSVETRMKNTEQNEKLIAERFDHILKLLEEIKTSKKSHKKKSDQ